MPYFVYKIIEGAAPTGKALELQDKFGVYKDARALARAMRAQLEVGDPSIIKIIFAENQDEAEERLTETRDAPILKEWEK